MSSEIFLDQEVSKLNGSYFWSRKRIKKAVSTSGRNRRYHRCREHAKNQQASSCILHAPGCTRPLHLRARCSTDQRASVRTRTRSCARNHARWHARTRTRTRTRTRACAQRVAPRESAARPPQPESEGASLRPPDAASAGRPPGAGRAVRPPFPCRTSMKPRRPCDGAYEPPRPNTRRPPQPPTHPTGMY